MNRIIKIKNKECKKASGITLIALVITIVILIILATVTINMAFGENGLIQQAELARDMTANSTVAENEGMNSLMEEYANVMAEDEEIEEPEEPKEPATDGTFSTEEGVNTPNIGDNMQLVVFDEDTSTWVEDTTKEAYSYKDTATEGANSSQWANAKVTIDGIDSYFLGYLYLFLIQVLQIYRDKYKFYQLAYIVLFYLVLPLL